MTEAVQIYLLGAPAVQWGGQPLIISRRQVRALLYRLAAESRPLSRSYLGFLFWDNLPENAARRSLSRLLAYLSRQLPNPEMIQADETHVQLQPKGFWIDTLAFERDWETWKSERQTQILRSAVEAFRGAFLEGFSLSGSPEFNAWASLEAEHWEIRHLKTLAILIEDESLYGDASRAIEYANRYLARDSLAEDVHRRLIELYAAMGDRSAALRQYERCVAILERELGVDPAPETRAAYRAVVDSETRHDQSSLHIQPSWSISPGLQIPFVGRLGPLQLLEAALGRARAGRGEIVFLSGEPGIGKTRLMQEFARRQRIRTRLLVGSGARDCCTLPYQPLVEAIRPALNYPELLSHVPKVWIAEASRLLPELSELVSPSQIATPLNPEIARARLFEALFRLLVGLTRDGYTILLCLDDLQWVNASTLEWLAYLGRHIAAHRMLVVGSYRSEDVDVLADFRASLARRDNFMEIPIAGLESQDVWRIFCSLGESLPVNEVQADRLRRITGGNPFFLLETLRVILEINLAQGKPPDFENLPMPATVQAAVSARLERLRPQVCQILEAASVLGPAFTLEGVHLTSGRQEMEVLDGLDELVARQFLVEETSGFQFCHAIIREAVYAGLGYWRRRKLHQRAGEALEKLDSVDWPAIAWHYEKAGEQGRAARYYLRAGQGAKAVFAHDQARASLDRALTLLEDESTSLKDTQALAANQRLRIQTLYERGWALRLLGEMDAYTRDLESVAELARALGDPRALAHLHWQEAYNHRWFCRYDAASKAAQEGLGLSRVVADPFLEAVCLREVGMAARETGDIVQAKENLERALAIFSRIHETVYSIHTMGNLSTLFLRQQQPERAMQLARQALEVCEAASLSYERRLPLGDIGAAAAVLGEIERAKILLSESLSIAHEIADRTQEIFCLGHLGWIQIHQGDHSRACAYLQEALDLAERIGSLSEQSWLHAGLAKTCVGMGEAEQARSQAVMAEQIALSTGRIPDLSTAQHIQKKLK